MFSIRSKVRNAIEGGQHVPISLDSISYRTLFRVFGFTFAFVVAIQAVRTAAPAIVLLFTAFFLALALNAPVHWIAQHLPGKKRGSRSIATVLAVVIVLAGLVGFLASIVPPFVHQIGGLVNTVPRFVNDLKDSNSQIGGFIDKYNLSGQVDNFTNDLSGKMQGLAGSAVDIVGSIGGSAFATLTVLVLTFMMLVEGPHWVSVGERLVPKRHRKHSRELARAMYRVIKGYVNGQVILAAMAAVLILPIFFIMGVSYPIALMVVVFICGLIPMVGHTIGAVIATAVALFTSPLAAVVVLAYYILYQQIENYLIQPKIQSNSTNMSPLLVFASVVLGVNFGGLLGGLVAIPVMGCIRILVIDQLSSRKILESESAKETLEKAKA